MAYHKDQKLVLFLFRVYTNDIVSVSDVVNMIMFADDSNLFFSGSDFNSMSNLNFN